MEITQLYATVGGSIFFFLILVNARPYIEVFLQVVSVWASKCLTYPQLLNRHRYLGPWSGADVVVQLLYIAINIFCISFHVQNISTAGLRAAKLSLINMVPNFAGPHLGFLADILGVPLSMYKGIHRSSGIMAALHLIFHVLVVTGSRTPFSVQVAENLWGLIGCSTLFLLLILANPFLRNFSYEIYIRAHQALAAVSAYSIWRHLELKPLALRIYAYIFTITFLLVLLLQGLFIHRSKARVIRVGDTVQVELSLRRPLKVKAGQYINLWFPSLGFWSLFQSHPFTVASWSHGAQETLDLFVEPREGMTRELLRHLTPSVGISKPRVNSLSRLALFSGPHGISAPVGDYETILMIASGSGIVAQLPYLKQLIYGYNAHKSRTRRVHLVWQLESRETGTAVQSIINDVIRDDGFRILSISMYIKSGEAHLIHIVRKADEADQDFGPSKDFVDVERIFKRAGAAKSPPLVQVNNGFADLKTIFIEESGEHRKEILKEGVGERGKMLVIVSAANELRDQLRGIVRPYLGRQVSLLELEYQPARL